MTRWLQFVFLLLATSAFAYAPAPRHFPIPPNLAGIVMTTTFDATETFPVSQTVAGTLTSTGQPRYQKSADGSTNGWVYYLDGRLATNFFANGAYWWIQYDDANRTVTRTFCAAGGTPLATNVTLFDRRGNAIAVTDAGGNTFTNTFDGLDRLKSSAGPVTMTVSATNMDFQNPIYVTNFSRQITGWLYDGAGRSVTVTNALGEKSVITNDALGRTVWSGIYPAGGTTPLRVTTASFAANHHNLTVTEGSGADAIKSTIYSDNDGQPVLTIGYPSAAAREFTRLKYDRAGNLVLQERNSSAGGAITRWTSASFGYDGLGRVTATTGRDNAQMFFMHDPMGNVTNRTMPGGLKWNATFNNAGQVTKDWNVGSGGSGTKTNSYGYFTAGSPYAGLLQTRTDGAGVTCTYSYDDWLRLATSSHDSPDNVYGLMVTTWDYDPRGLVTSVLETWSDRVIQVLRSYDSYAQLTSETILAQSNSVAGQGWDAAGRRTGLSVNGQNYNFGWRADGLLASVSMSGAGGAYGYNSAGVLTNRLVGSRSTTISSLDGAGRPLAITTKVNLLTKLTETLTWTGDGLLGAHTVAREDFTDTRGYSYANLSRRLTEERLNLDGSTRWTNVFAYDDGTAAGPGALTRIGAANSGAARWSGAKDAFSRINSETNTSVRRTAWGRVNGQATIVASLDGVPQPVLVGDTYTSPWSRQWLASLDLTPGVHQLQVSASHPSGLFTTNATSVFTNNVASEQVTETFDGRGNVTQRVWRSAGGATNRTQTFTWDLKGRLWKVTGWNPQGKDIFAHHDYDPMGRRMYSVLYETGFGGPAQWVGSYYDPSVEFLEMGTWTSGGQRTWKLCGPDANGSYGGLNGVGGLEGTTTGLGAFQPALSDTRGNVLGEVTNGVMSWTAARPTGYGAVTGRRPAPYGSGVSLASASAWRSKWPDATGYINLGARYYDPEAGSFLSTDPVWNGGDPNYHTFAGGDPVNYFDQDGRESQQSIYVRPEGNRNPSVFQLFFPAHAAMMGARPISGSTMMDIRRVHTTTYPAMTPVTLPGRAYFNPRVQGGLKVVGGTVEAGTGVVGLATTSETGVGAFVSAAALGHGIDTAQSGWRQMMSGEPTSSFTEQGLTYLTGSARVGAFGDAALGMGLTMGAGSYAGPRMTAWHESMQIKYTWGAPPGGQWFEGVGATMRNELKLSRTGAELHHWLIPQNQWGSRVPNYIKNQPWNIMVMESRKAHAMVDTAFSVRGVEPYPLPLRLWMGMPTKARVGVVGAGLGVGYLGWEAYGTDASDADSSATPLGKKQTH